MAQGLPDSFRPLETTPSPPVNTGLPETFRPIEDTHPELAQQPEQGLLSRGWHAISDPLTTIPSQFASSIADYIDQPSLNRSPMMASLQGFGAGALQGLGDVVSGFTSPLNIATMGGSALEKSALLEGIPALSKLVNIGGRVAGGLTAAHGAGEVLNPESTLSQRGFGLAEFAGGASAAFHSPSVNKLPKLAPEEIAASKPFEAIPKEQLAGLPEGVRDEYATFRADPVGTTYNVSPDKFNMKTATEAARLGIKYREVDVNGRIILKKESPSPSIQQPRIKANEDSIALQVANIPRTLMASMDLSAPLRQGLGLIHKTAFWKALPDMFRALGSEEAYNNIRKEIMSDPLFMKRVLPNGKVDLSFAEKSGLALTDLNSMTTREESIMSQMAERVWGVRASNRAYTTFLNKLRADTFKQMTRDYGTYGGPGARNNLVASRAIAEYINVASGRGSFGLTGETAKKLSTILFSPRLMAARLQMMGKGAQAVFSPEVYMTKGPNIRREYLKSLFSMAAASGTFVGLSMLSGAEVESDVASSDFGKVKFGDTRIDPYGGFQQYIVLAQRLMPHIDLSSVGLEDIGVDIGGKMKSTTTQREYSLGDPGFGRSDQATALLRFIRGKTTPLLNFAWGLAAGQRELSGKRMQLGYNEEQNPVENVMKNSLMQRFIPMLSQDIFELINDETTPTAAKLLAGTGAMFGMGSQTYGKD